MNVIIIRMTQSTLYATIMSP